MSRCTTCLTLAACVLAVPGAMAQQPAPAASPSLSALPDTRYAASSRAGTPYGSGPYAGEGYDGSGGEGNSGSGGSPGEGDSASATASSGGGAARAVEVILKASGVPNQKGQVTWPLGLRLLRVDEQLQQIEAQLRLAAEQVTAGGANPQLLHELRRNVKALRQVVLADKAERFSLPLAVYEDAERFLDKLTRAPEILAASPPAGRSEETGR
jgi:hypothetical protein